jgi:anthranilate/para-aminobenzoate synthase component I
MNALFDRLRETRGACALLESSSSAGPLARRTLLARHPHTIVVADGRHTAITTAAGTRTEAGDPLDHLRPLQAALRRGAWPDEGAIVGALAYDYARPRGAPESRPRLVAFAVDALHVVEDGRTLAAPRGAAAPPLDVPLSGTDTEPSLAPTRPIALARHSNLTPAAYEAHVARLKEHIAAGDIYQANLSQRFRLRWPGAGLGLYEALRRRSPSPFGGYFRVGGLEIVSASPERLLLVDGDALSTRPIAGTRPRSTDPSADRALAEELLLSEKERAEHLMLVDLARNDLGRVARVGTVVVDELMVVEDYSHVRHIVSNVAATLAPGFDAVDALRALFPGGTITGVPKIRCMDILDRLEVVPRGFYTGALFYWTASGRLDANILIRSATVASGVATFNTGAGIVADSDPGLEYEETLHKAEGMRVAMEAALES